MPVRTGRVVEAMPNRKFPKRYDVWLHEQEPGHGGPNTPLFTLEPVSRNWIAAFCAAAKERGRRVMVWTMDTQYGERIVKVDWQPEQSQEVA